MVAVVHITFTMKLIQSSKLYLNLFYISGFSPYQRTNANGRIFSIGKISKFLQAIVCKLASIIALCRVNGIFPHKSRTDITVIQMYLISDLIRSVFILVQCLLYKDVIYEINQVFLDLETYFSEYFGHRICYQKFIKKYRLKAGVVIGCCLTYFVTFFFHLAVKDDVANGIPASALKILQLMTAISLCHSIFYIELLKYHLKQLNLVIRRDSLQLSNEILINNPVIRADVLNKIRCYKIAHFRLWLVNQRINKYFGYSIIGILMHIFTDTVYSIFWVYELFYFNYFISSIWSMFLCAVFFFAILHSICLHF